MIPDIGLIALVIAFICTAYATFASAYGSWRTNVELTSARLT